jgi:hypothetical protein
MEFDQSLLGETPKAFEAIDIHFARREAFPMIDSKMTIAAEHKSIIAPELIGVYNRSTTDRFDGHAEQGLCRNVFDDFDLDRPVALQNAENRNFSGCPATTLPFAPTTKIAFVQLNFTTEKQVGILTGDDSESDDRDCLQDRRITQAYLLGNLPGRNFEFKELNDPQPLLKRDVQLIDPAIREVVEGVFTSFASVSSADDPIDFSASTACTKNRPIFPTRFFKEKSRSIFRLSNKFKGF